MSEQQEYQNLLKQREPEYARQAVERFVRRFEPSYRKLVSYAALPLVLTPELLHYLRNHFLRREQVPWVAEVDLLLSDLCREVGYELYAMETAVRAYALQELRKQPGGAQQMRSIAWLLLSYVQQLARHPAVSRQELEAQQWAAMAYLHEKREEAVGQIVTALRRSAPPAAAAPDISAFVNRAEFLRLARLVQELAPELEQYPELVEYARDVTQVFANPASLPPERLRQTRRVLGQALPELGRLAPEAARVEIIERGAAGPREWTEPLTGMEFVWIPPGRFLMGQSEVDKEYLIQEIGEEKYKESYLDELPRHKVLISQGFWMGKYLVTQGQWLEIMGKNPSHFDEKKVGEQWREHPVDSVSWDDCQEFVRKLNEQGRTPPRPSPKGRETPPPLEGDGGRFPDPFGEGSGVGFRLPSEAEWEYACRAGSEGLFCFGDEVEQLQDYAWYNKNSDNETHPVGQLQPNSWGLYDMHGNVWEWCQDVWHDNYEGAPVDGRAWEEGKVVNKRLLRGGSWLHVPRRVRCAVRDRHDPGLRFNDWGFRVVCGVVQFSDF